MAVFRIGQKVVCVDDAPPFGCFWSGPAPRFGKRYTVRAVVADRIAVEEIPNVTGGVDGFLARRFRPAVDIEQFRALVEPAALQQVKRELVDA